MRLPKSLDLATRLVREGKLGEALTTLGGGGPSPRAPKFAPAWPNGRGGPAGSAALKATLDAGLGALGRFTPPTGSGRGDAAAPPPVPAGARFIQRRFDGSTGSLAYKLFIPSSAGPAPLPLVVMLHGCTQSPDDFAAGTRMNALAERDGVYVAYPAQSRGANAQKCWNWFRPEDQGRSGEPALVAGLVREIIRDEAVDPARVYVAGLSAGGAAAAVLGQSYPELFAAVGVHSGLACRAAADMASAFAAMKSGAVGQPAGSGIPTIVFHGDRDATVAPINGAQVLAQAEPAGRLATSVEEARAPGGLDYTRTVQADAAGRPQSEHWVLHGAGHAWSGGDLAGTYTEPRGPDASEAMLRFFRHHRLDGQG